MAQTWMRRALAIGVVVVAATAGAVTAGAVGETGGADGGAPPDPRAGSASPTESVFVPITPCRIVNTQNPAGRFAAGELRSYDTNSGTAAQGGAADCKIPASATALEVSVSAVSATGPGYLRLHPAGVATPTATFLNYGPAQNITNAGTVAIRTGANQANLSVRAYEAPTHVVIDVLGYYVTELFAAVPAGADLAARGNGVTSVDHVGNGQYNVIFNRNVAGCAYMATPGSLSGSIVAGDAVVVPMSDNANGVVVQTYGTDGFGAIQPFYLTVDC